MSFVTDVEFAERKLESLYLDLDAQIFAVMQAIHYGIGPDLPSPVDELVRAQKMILDARIHLQNVTKVLNEIALD